METAADSVSLASMRLIAAETGHVVTLPEQATPKQALKELLASSELAKEPHRRKITAFIERYQNPQGALVPMRVKDRIGRMVDVAASI